VLLCGWQVFAPKELIGSSALHIVHLGVAIHGGHLLRTGDVWGEDMLLAARHLRARTLVRAITYLEVHFIDRDSLLNIAAEHSESLERIRRRTRYLALRRSIVLVSKVAIGLSQHRRQVGISPRALAARACASGSVSRARWHLAFGMVRAMRGAQQSFKRNHQEYVGHGRREGNDTAVQKVMAVAAGSELDQRVERSRESKLCTTLFQLAAQSQSTSSGLFLAAGGAAAAASAPRAADGDAPPAGSADGVATVAARADASPAAARQGVLKKSGVVNGAGHADASHANGGSQAKLPVEMVREVSRGGGSPGASYATSFKQDRASSSTTADAPPRSFHPLRAASRGGGSPAQHTHEHFGCSVLGLAGASASDAPGRGGGSGGDGGGGGSFVVRGAARMQQRMRREASGRGQLTKSMDAMNARVDALTAANEAMRSEFSALAEQLLSAARGQPLPAAATVGGADAPLDA
jgi:hypothetical protein